jgi:hypothetical protein
LLPTRPLASAEERRRVEVLCALYYQSARVLHDPEYFLAIGPHPKRFTDVHIDGHAKRAERRLVKLAGCGEALYGQ